MNLSPVNPTSEPTTSHAHSAGLARLIEFYETLSPKSLHRIATVYAERAYFKDPFNEMNQLADIQAIFEHMFVQVSNPRFEIQTAFEQGDQAFLSWHFLFESKAKKNGKSWKCRGSSHIQFDTQGQVVYHRDYWDPAEELYEKIPVLGALMRWIKKQAG